MRLSIGFLTVALTTAACGTGVDSEPRSLDGSGGGGSQSPHDSGNFCQQASGPRHDWTTLDELSQLIVGRWAQCSDRTFSPLAHGRGIEIAPGGKYFVLFDDGDGGLVRRSGFANEGTWDTKELAGGPPYVELWSTPSSVFGGSPMFEDDPRRFAIEFGLVDTDLAVYQQIAP